jgi:hypothetical protein
MINIRDIVNLFNDNKINFPIQDQDIIFAEIKVDRYNEVNYMELSDLIMNG